ncbi:hypothetical protein [Cecembia calidifontis]|uniref:6-bladed beta-propeller protein n=1 Tax=Cecembia calidifontis TaxID=1187080 RepID=A0A4Q7P469_9BACT|nr:hypothetical protein [Cecembia calidifontis]RZS94654.1 hypothetical protein BC751_0155 [Cecembia calidifontis]
MIKFISHLTILLFILGCSKVQTEKIQLLPTEKFSDYDLDYFLSSLSSIEFVNDTFYITEYDYSRLLILNRDFSKYLIIDDSNEDSGVSYPTFSIPIDNKIAVYNSGKQRIDFYTNEGKFIENLSLKVNSELLNFTQLDNKLVYSILLDDLQGQFIIHDQYSHEIKRFGELTNVSFNKFQEIYNSKGYIFPLKKGFITVLPTTGEITIYDSDLNLSYSTNILEEINLKSVKENIYNFYKTTTNSTIDIVSDCKFYDDKLFILIYNRKPEERPNPRQIIVFNIHQNEKIRLETIYTIGEINSYYSKICIIPPDKIAAFELQTSDIHIFELK